MHVYVVKSSLSCLLLFLFRFIFYSVHSSAATWTCEWYGYCIVVLSYPSESGSCMNTHSKSAKTIQKNTPASNWIQNGRQRQHSLAGNIVTWRHNIYIVFDLAIRFNITIGSGSNNHIMGQRNKTSYKHTRTHQQHSYRLNVETWSDRTNKLMKKKKHQRLAALYKIVYVLGKCRSLYMYIYLYIYYIVEVSNSESIESK